MRGPLATSLATTCRPMRGEDFFLCVNKSAVLVFVPVFFEALLYIFFNPTLYLFFKKTELRKWK